MKNPLAIAIKESPKAIAVKVLGDKRLAWFPKSVCELVVDDYYAQKQDKWMLPEWLVKKKAAEFGVMQYEIGG